MSACCPLCQSSSCSAISSSGVAVDCKQHQQQQSMPAAVDSAAVVFSCRHLTVFIVTFISYGLYHAARKTLSGVKSTITEDWLHSGQSGNASHHQGNFFDDAAEAATFLGTLDAVFMAVYAAAMFYWGWLGDRLDPRKVVAVGMFGSGITLCLFGALPKWTHFYSMPYYLIAYILFGVFQACGWPNEVAIMANWFGRGNRGFVLGLWASCQPVGNIFGSMITAAVLPYGYQVAFVLNAVLIFLFGLVVLFCIRSRPFIDEHQPGYRPIDADDDASESSGLIGHHVESRQPPPIGFLQAILLPSVLAYCLCTACVKLVNYAFFFWLPVYLHGKYQWEEAEADQLSIWYDIGGIFGSVLGGIVSDRIGCRSPIIVVLLTASLGILFGYSQLPLDKTLNAVVMTAVGFCISGPYNLIVGTISADLGSQPALLGNAQAMSTVSGLIDGTGSAGSAVGQIIVPVINNHFGWDYVFYMFIVMNTLAVICLLHRFVLDIRQIVEKVRHSPSDTEPLLADQRSSINRAHVD